MGAGEVRQKLRSVFLHENVVLLSLAVVIGVIAAYVALGLRESITGIHFLLYQSHTENLTSSVRKLQWWHVLLAPTVGGLLVGLINWKFAEGRRGQGVASIIEANALKGAEMNPREGLVSAVANSLSIGVGASVGREGPILHLTSTVASWCAGRLRLQTHHRHTLLGCAVAAAVAASFNAPIAGVFFALEVVLRHYSLTAFAPVVLASVIGTMVTRVHFGDFPAFVLPHYELTTFWEFPAFLLLGLVAGGAAIIFMKSVFLTEDVVAEIKIPVWLKTAFGGAAVGGLALIFPEVMGVGYETTNQALNQTLSGGLEWLLLLIVFKTAAAAISTGTGFGGGVFSPSLFIGAIIGSAFGTIAAIPFPAVEVQTGLYAIVGMASVAAAVLGAPISTILMVFELLGDFKVTIGVMSGAAVSSLLVQSLTRRSVYFWQLERKGVKLEGARAMQILREQVVGDVVNADFFSVEATTKLPELIDFLHTLPEDTEAVVVEDGYRFVGTISLADVKDVAFDPLANQDAIEAQTFVRLYPAVLTVDQTLARAIGVMEKWNAERLPVVQDEESMTIAGLVDKNTLLSAYVSALLQAESEAHG